MSGATLDRLLALLVVAQVATGLLTLRSGVPTTAPLFWLHGLLAGVLLVAVVLKLRRSIGPAVGHGRWRRLALGLALALLAATALGLGFTWVASARILWLGPWTILTIHVFAALALLPIAVLHLLPHRWRLLRPRSATARRTDAAGPSISRRTLLAAGAMVVVGAAAWGTANLLDRIQGGVRRFTGSRWLPDGGIPPPTTFYGEPPPDLDVGAWRLRVHGRVARPLTLTGEQLAALGTVEREEVLDCTSGWAMRTTWRGTPLRAVLDEAGAEPGAIFVKVRSATGWMVPLEREDLGGALLATHVAGEPLPHRNGAPCRLVAPRRRGLDWVKWVTEVEVA
jgi:DMSO/TMAO reductase YedYZ molybdopterin-dependent catalytic subunit